MDATDDTVDRLLGDPILAVFLEDDFDVDSFVRSVLAGDDLVSTSADTKTQNMITAALSSIQPTASLEETPAEAAFDKLRLRSAQVETALRAIVQANQESFLTAAGHTADAKSTVNKVSAKLSAITSVTSRMREDVFGPFTRLKAEVRSLQNILAAGETLRLLQNVLFNIKRLKTYLGFPFEVNFSSEGASAPLPAPLPASVPVPEEMAARLLDTRLLLKVAPLAREVESQLQLPQLAGIRVVEAERTWLQPFMAALRANVNSMFEKAADTLHASDVGFLLQVLHDLGDLKQECDACVYRAVLTATSAMQEALDVRHVAVAAQNAIEGGAGTSATTATARAVSAAQAGNAIGPAAVAAAASSMSGLMVATLQPAMGAAAAWRGVLWSRVETMCEALQRHALQIWNVAFVLSQRRDSHTRQALALDLLDQTHSDGNDGDLRHPAARMLQRFWLQVTQNIHNEMDAVLSAEVNTFIKSTLVENFTRLHYLLLDIPAKLSKSVALRASSEDAVDIAIPGTRNSISAMSGSQIFASACDTRRLVWCVAGILRLYLARSLGKLNEALNQMFSGSLPAGSKTKKLGGRNPSLAASVPFFSTHAEIERAMDDIPMQEAPSVAATNNFVRLVQSELSACHPVVAAGSNTASAFSLASPAMKSSVSASIVLSSVQPDPALYAAVAKGVSTSLKLLVARTESVIQLSPSATMVADHFMPSPVQLFNMSLLQRIDDVRKVVIKLCMDIPVPVMLEHLAAVDENSAIVKERAQRQTAMAPFAHRLPAGLLMIAELLERKAIPQFSAAECEILTKSAEQTAQGFLLRALSSLDRIADSIARPWLLAMVAPLEKTVLKLHDVTYSSSEPDAKNAIPPSEYLIQLSGYISALATHQLALLPSGFVGDVVRQSIAVRMLSLYVRNVCMLRHIDEFGLAKIAQDAGELQAALAPLVDVSKLGRSYAELKALRPLLHMPASELLSAISMPAGDKADPAAVRRAKILTLLRTLRASNTLHAMLARHPDTCSMPYTKLGMSIHDYNGWLDVKAVEGVLLTVSSTDIKYRESEDRTSFSPLFVPEPAMRHVDEAVRDIVKACALEYKERESAVGASSPEAEGFGGAEYELIVNRCDELLHIARTPAPTKQTIT